MARKRRGGSRGVFRRELWTDLCLGLRSIHGADARASAALKALLGVDDALVISESDSAHGALVDAGLAGDAIVGDLICHSTHLLDNKRQF